MLLEYDDSLDTTRSTEFVHCTSNCLLNFCLSWSFTAFHSYEYPRSEQSLWSNRIVVVSSSNLTAGNRDLDYEQKTGAHSFICSAPSRGKSFMGFLDLLKVFIVSELSIVHHWSCVIRNKRLWRLHRKIKRSCLRFCACIFSRQISRDFAVQSACREVSSSGCSSKTGAQGFRSWGSPSPDCLFPEFNFVPGASWEFLVCHRSVQSQFFNFPQNRIHWIWVLRYTTLTFSFRIATAPWVPSSRPRAEITFHRQHVEIGNDSLECICFQTCNHDTRDDVDNHTTIFFILPTIDKDF